MHVRNGPRTAHGRGDAAGGGGSPAAAFTVATDGIWTWFTDARSVQRNGYIYTMAVSSAGTCFIYKTAISGLTTTSFQLSSTGLEIDDHDNGSVQFLPDGRIVAWYGSHNDSVFRYRVSTNPEDITSWSAEQQRGTGGGPYSYPNTFRFSNASGKDWYFNRRGGGGSAYSPLSYRTCTDITTIPAATWSAAVDVYYAAASSTPYWKLAHDGANRVHVAVTDKHPVQGQSSLYHFYIECQVGGTLKYYTSAGVEITAGLPFAPANCTQVYDGTTTKSWVSDCTIDGSGYPRILYMVYPGNDGSAIEYWHARWNGSAWSSAKICNDGAGLYAPEVYYHGGMCFDSMDPTKVYLSAPETGVRQIQEWRTTDSGATWAKFRSITSGGTAGTPLKGRPYSPRNHGSEVALMWWEGTYTTFTNYNTAVKAAG